MVFGRWLTLRRTAELSRDGRIHDAIGFGGPALSLARVLWTLSASFETDIGRCHARLRPSEQDKIDVFVQAMKVVARAADAMIHVPPYDPATAEDTHRHLYEALTVAAADVERAGDAADHALDPTGARRAAEERRNITRAQHDREGAALAVLVDNGHAIVAAANAVNLASLERQDDLYQAISRIRELGLHVESAAFFDATDAARKAHRAITYETLAQAQVASGDVDEVRRLFNKLPAQVLALEELATLPRPLRDLEPIER